MITQPTVLILGAGSSMPYKFSSGLELTRKIIGYRGDKELNFLIENYQINSRIVIELADKLKYSGATSIDLFLERESASLYRDTGKLLIAKTLLQEEQSSLQYMYEDPEIGHWYQYFWNKIYHRDVDTFVKNKLTVINFNYDRSFEHYLLKCIGVNPKNEDEVFKIFRSTIEFIHPYGCLGNLHSGNTHFVPYGNGNKAITKDVLSKAASEIKIIYEGSNADGTFRHCREELLKARRIYVMGFGYHPENVTRLGLKELEIGSGGRSLIAGCYKIFQFEVDNYIKELLPDQSQITIQNSDCINYLRNYFIFN